MRSSLPAALVWALALLVGAPAAAAPANDDQLTPAEEVDMCLGCHGLASSEMKLATGQVMSLRVDRAALAKSSHKKLACTDCHADLKGIIGAHPKKPLPGKRDFAIAYSEACKKCHFSNYKDTLDSVHRARISAGDLRGAVCSDCHGAHDVTPAAEPRAKIALSCGKCHRPISDVYARSVHGRSLIGGSDDVPSCTDCHRSHAIADPRAGAWRLKTPELCGNCHANEKLMKKYGLSSNVLQTYLADFHGVTVKLSGKSESPVVALCTDCHGVHDIARVRDPASKVIKANILATCAKCHPDAKGDFPSSWLSHYQPSLKKAPLVWLIRVAYLIFIPFMIGGLGLQIALHLWRITVNR